MKIQNILNEAKLSPSTYAYHATKAAYLKSILKHGLVPNFSDDGYGSDELSHAGYSLTPLKGVYFTRTGKQAMHIAKSLQEKSIVIICKVQLKQADLDEDRLTADVVKESQMLAELRSIISSNYNSIEDFDDAAQVKFAKIYSNYIIDESMSNLDSRLINNIKPHLQNYVLSIVKFFIASETDSFIDEHESKQYRNILTKKLKIMLHHSHEVNKTFKIDATIGFSGANKIVGVYDMYNRVGWGDLGDLSGYEYHLVDSPIELLTR